MRKIQVEQRWKRSFFSFHDDRVHACTSPNELPPLLPSWPDDSSETKMGRRERVLPPGAMPEKYQAKQNITSK